MGVDDDIKVTTFVGWFDVSVSNAYAGEIELIGRLHGRSRKCFDYKAITWIDISSTGDWYCIPGISVSSL